MTVVRLNDPFNADGGTIDKVEFREPRFADYAELGDPRAPILRGDAVYTIPIPEVVKAYVTRLVVDLDVKLLAEASLLDAIQFQNAILKFFVDADDEGEDDARAGFVSLTKAYPGHRAKVEELEFREPRLDDFLTLGDPRATISLSDSKAMTMAVPSIVRTYAERLCQTRGFSSVEIVTLQDAMRIERSILRFFVEADLKMRSAASPETSPSP